MFKFKRLSLTLLLIPGLALATSQPAGNTDTDESPLDRSYSYVPQGAASASSGDNEIMTHLEFLLFMTSERPFTNQDFSESLGSFPAVYLDRTQQLLLTAVDLGVFGGVKGGREIQVLLQLALNRGSDEMLQLIVETLVPLRAAHDFLFDTSFFLGRWNPQSTVNAYFKLMVTQEIKDGRKLGILLLNSYHADHQSVVFMMAKNLLQQIRHCPEKFIQLAQFVAAYHQQRAIASRQIQNALGEYNVIPDLSRIIADYALPQIPAALDAVILLIPVPPYVRGQVSAAIRQIQEPDPMVTSHLRRQAEEKKKKE